MAELKPLLRSFELEPVGAGSYRAPNANEGHGVVFGGQLIGQSMLAAARDHEGKSIKTVHTIFARAAAPDADVEIDVDVMHGGRAFGSSSVTIRQGDRLCTRSLVLLSADDADLMRHADPAPEVTAPDDLPARSDADWDTRVVGGVDLSDPAVGPPTLDVWTRWNGAPDDPLVSQALVAYTTDPFLIGTAMRPHAGISQAQSHKTLSAGVISHTITFHEPVDAADWVLLSHHSTYAGHGRIYGRANMYQHGVLIGSFVQDAMARPMQEGARL